jgi:hypothetical protein
LAAETPKRGGILTFVVASYPPGLDGHREYTFAMLQPTRPFYSVLIRVNPENPSSPTDFIGDLALEVPRPADGGKKYTFRLRKNARFWDGQPVTARDVVASFNKIIFPPPGVVSARKAFYSMVDKVYTEDDYTVTFALKYPSSAFIPALANPFNYVYSAKKLAKNMHWYEKNILGSGPFIFGSLHLHAAETRRLHRGQAQPQLPSRRKALSGRFPGHLRRKALSGRFPGHLLQSTVETRGGHPQGGGNDRVPRLPAQKPRNPEARPGGPETGTAISSWFPTIWSSPSTTPACAAPSPWPSTAGAAQSASPGSPL